MAARLVAHQPASGETSPSHHQKERTLLPPLPTREHGLHHGLPPRRAGAKRSRDSAVRSADRSRREEDRAIAFAQAGGVAAGAAAADAVGRREAHAAAAPEFSGRR